MINFNPLWKTMSNKGITKYNLIYKKSFPKNTLDRMKKNMPASTRTIDDLCKLLDCEVGDIIEYIKED